MDLFAYARNTDPVTSHGAAAALDVSGLQLVVLDALKAHPEGLTTIEIASISGIERDTVSPRIRPLVDRGLVRDSGKKRVSEGRRVPAIVWVKT